MGSRSVGFARCVERKWSGTMRASLPMCDVSSFSVQDVAVVQVAPSGKLQNSHRLTGILCAISSQTPHRFWARYWQSRSEAARHTTTKIPKGCPAERNPVPLPRMAAHSKGTSCGPFLPFADKVSASLKIWGNWVHPVDPFFRVAVDHWRCRRRVPLANAALE